MFRHNALSYLSLRRAPEVAPPTEWRTEEGELVLNVLPIVGDAFHCKRIAFLVRSANRTLRKMLNNLFKPGIKSFLYFL